MKKNTVANHPNLVSEWHQANNGTLKPCDVSYGSNLKVYWICQNNNKHIWLQAVKERTTGKRKCPFCYGRKVGNDNNITVTHPWLVSEWHELRNGDFTPKQASKGMSKVAWWRCMYGHEWHSAINLRTRKKPSGCPNCKIQKTSRDEIRVYVELLPIWSNIKWGELIFGKEIDIFIPDLNIGIEVDGGYWHNKRIHQDIKKSKYFESRGIQIIRLRDNLCVHDFEKSVIYTSNSLCVNDIKKVLELIIKNKSNQINKNKLGLINNYLKLNDFANASKFYDLVSKMPLEPLKNNLVKTHKHLIEEWDAELNAPLKPSMFTKGSGIVVNWKSACGHRWKMAIKQRVAGQGCPYCAGKKLELSGSLQFKFPELAKEWHPHKNGTYLPQHFKPGSGKKAIWMCRMGHEWSAVIYQRAKKGQGCPYCSGHKLAKENSLSSTHPKLAEEWHKDKNIPLTPFDVSKGQTKSVWWFCKKKHTWKSKITDRVRGRGCPECAGRSKGSKRTLVVKKHNISISHPSLIPEWFERLNLGILPEYYTAGSGVKVWWQCKKNHTWMAAIKDRTAGKGCRQCWLSRFGS